jgi:hypothetical protein
MFKKHGCGLIPFRRKELPRCLVIENVENEMDPMLDPVLEKAIVMKAGPLGSGPDHRPMA